ncbi:MAG TPA: aminoglycoside phosphotransferase family protein [Solirubrobacteraceae bacterium]
MTITIPPQLAAAADEDDDPERVRWLASLPQTIEEIATDWELKLGEPYLPGGQCAWVAPARSRGGDQLVLKVGWRHREAEHEADALRLWDGEGAVRCVATRAQAETTVLLLERCDPGVQLKRSLPEPEQDVVVAGLARRLWERLPAEGHPFSPLTEMCDLWADSFQQDLERDPGGLDPGLAREGITTLRQLPRTADRPVLLCTDLHAENILSAGREPWLVIDPKPFLGDPAFDAVQHMLNCDQRLATDPEGLAERMAALLDVDPARVRLWLFARCAQESLHDPTMREPARRLAP